MYIPLPILILGGLALLGLLAWALLRDGSGRGDLTGPPRGAPPIRHGQDRSAGWAGSPAPSAVAPIGGGFVELSAEDREEIWKLAHTGYKINAIKLVRERTGLGLREAKDYVEAMRQDDITLR